MQKVSVIVPNYNHAPYLSQRIDSILNQSFKDFEIIILDDCSPDNSREIIARYKSENDRIKVVLNEENSGSTFKQWNKGISLATGEYIWIAESDDYADPEFLATLVTRMDNDTEIVLSYCNSYSVDENSQLMPVPTWEPYLLELDAELWKDNFTDSGLQLVRRYMSYRNLIPNASAVLLRRSAIHKVGLADGSLRILGDWLFWAKIMVLGKVDYVATPLNYFRTHRNNVRSKTFEDGTSLVERTQLVYSMRQYGLPDPTFYEKSFDLMIWLWGYTTTRYNIPLENQRTIYQNLILLEPGRKGYIIRSLIRFLFFNRFEGIRFFLQKIFS